MDTEEEGIGIGLDTACRGINCVSSTDSETVTDSGGAKVIFSLLDQCEGKGHLPPLLLNY